MKLIICFILIISCLKSNGQISDTIYWSPCYKLKWEDFKGTPDTFSEHGAVSNIHIKYSFRSTDKEFTYKIYCFFYTPKSWVRIPTSDGLIHEQGHFNIGEIFARKFRRAIKLYKFNPTTISSDFKKIATQINQEKGAMNDLYDKETDFHRNDINQAKWNKKIEKELVLLSQYAN